MSISLRLRFPSPIKSWLYPNWKRDRNFKALVDLVYNLPSPHFSFALWYLFSILSAFVTIFCSHILIQLSGFRLKVPEFRISVVPRTSPWSLLRCPFGGSPSAEFKQAITIAENFMLIWDFTLIAWYDKKIFLDLLLCRRECPRSAIVRLRYSNGLNWFWWCRLCLEVVDFRFYSEKAWSIWILEKFYWKNFIFL